MACARLPTAQFMLPQSSGSNCAFCAFFERLEGSAFEKVGPAEVRWLGARLYTSRKGCAKMAPQRGGRRMFPIVEAIHKVLRTESSLVFVLVVAGIFAVGGGAVAWLVDQGYKNSPEYRKEHGSLATGRRLEEWQKVRMVAMLSPHSGQHVVILASAGEETATYANCSAPDFLDTELSLFMQQLLAQGAAAEPAAA